MAFRQLRPRVQQWLQINLLFIVPNCITHFIRLDLKTYSEKHLTTDKMSGQIAFTKTIHTRTHTHYHVA